MNPPSTSAIDQNYFKAPTESVDQYNSRVQTYNASKNAPTSTAPQSIIDNAKANPAVTSPTGKDVFGNSVATTPTQSTPPGTSSSYKPTDTSQEATNNDPAVMAAQAQLKATQDFNQHQADIQNGVIPLTSGEQAQIQNLQNQFQSLIDTQTTTNAGATGTAQIRGYQSGATEYDPTFQAKTIASISAAGAQKIANLQTQEASAVASLTQSFKDADIAASKAAFDSLQSAQKNVSDAIQKHVTDVQKAIKDAQDAKIAADKVTYETITKPIQDVLEKAVGAGAPAEVKKAIQDAQTAGDVNAAINAAGDYLQTATGTLGDYLQYKRDALAKGLTPDDYLTYQDKQDAKDQANKVALAYAQENAKNKADTNYTASDKVQQKLEQQYRQVLSKEFSARTGALGVENAKVNQANHLNSLFQQYYDPKTGNYNIPTAQYAELAIGLASMLAPTGQSSDADRAEIKSKTAAGDIKGALQYITGEPQNGNTQAIIKNLIDSVDRQAETATRNREAALEDMRAQAPTDLDPARVEALNKSTQMVPYEGQDRVSKSAVDNYVIANPSEKESIAKMYEVPGATDQDIEAYLKAQGKLQ